MPAAFGFPARPRARHAEVPRSCRQLYRRRALARRLRNRVHQGWECQNSYPRVVTSQSHRSRQDTWVGISRTDFVSPFRTIHILRSCRAAIRRRRVDPVLDASRRFRFALTKPTASCPGTKGYAVIPKSLSINEDQCGTHRNALHQYRLPAEPRATLEAPRLEWSSCLDCRESIYERLSHSQNRLSSFPSGHFKPQWKSEGMGALGIRTI